MTITEQRLREIASYDRRVRDGGAEKIQIAAELLAARAELLSMGVKCGLLETARDEARAENERLGAEVEAATAEKWKVKNRAKEACLAIVARLGSVGAESVDDAVARLLAENERLARQRDEALADAAMYRAIGQLKDIDRQVFYSLAKSVDAEQPKPAGGGA